MGKWEDSIEKIVCHYCKGDGPGMSLLVGKNGRILYENGFGLADLETGRHITPDTAFIIASVTKQFTAMAVMMLKQKGLLSYDEPISRFFPYFPPYKDKVTVRHLMTHTSGIREYFSEGFVLKIPETFKKISRQAVIDAVRELGPLEFEPGTRFSYCNSGYVMLGAIIEMVSGMTFADFLKDNIFKPCGMTSTTAIISPQQKIEKLASGYRICDDGTYVKTPYDMAAIGWADGNISSTAEDLFKWHNMLYTNELISRDTLNEAFTPYILKDGNSTGYGFGWFIGRRKGIKEIWHTGGTIGYTSKFSRFVDGDIAVIMLTNQMGIKRDEVFDRIVDVVLDD